MRRREPVTLYNATPAPGLCAVLGLQYIISYITGGGESSEMSRQSGAFRGGALGPLAQALQVYFSRGLVGSITHTVRTHGA